MTISGASEGIDGVTHVAGHKLDGLPDVTDGGPDMVQLIAPDGSRTPMSSVNEPYMEALKAITAEEVRAMYRDMVLVRRFDIEGYSLQRQGELGLWPQLLGQEAAQVAAGHAMREQDLGDAVLAVARVGEVLLAQVAAGHAMREQDFAYPGYREHGVA